MPIVQSVGNISGNSNAYGTVLVLRSVSYKFEINSIVYSIDKARRGVMEAVAIKDVRLISNRRTYNQIIPLYVDTFNSLWNEDDLCSELEAQTIAIEYLERLEILIQNQINNNT